MRRSIIIVLIIAMSHDSFAQFQRMLIPMGEYIVDGLSAIPSFCIDALELAPTSSQKFQSFSSNMYVTRNLDGQISTKPASEVEGKWINITGTDGNVNELMAAKVDKNDPATYTVRVVSGNGYTGPKGVNLSSPMDREMLKYTPLLNSITDPIMRKYAKQDALWGISKNKSYNDILSSIKQVKKSNNIDMRQINAIPDVTIKNTIKGYIYNQINDYYSIPEINSGIRKMLQINNSNYRLLDGISSNSVKSNAKVYALSLFLDEAEIAEVNSFINRVIDEEILHHSKLNNIKDERLKKMAGESIVYGAIDRQTAGNLSKVIDEYVKQDLDKETIQSFFKGKSDMIEELKTNGIDESSIAILIEEHKINFAENGKMTAESKSIIESFVETNKKMKKYRLLDYKSSTIEGIKKFQVKNHLEPTGYPDEKFSKILGEYETLFETVNDYKKAGTSSLVLASPVDYYSSEYIVSMNNKNYVFDYSGEVKALNETTIGVLENNYISRVESNSSKDRALVFLWVGPRNNNQSIKIQIGSTKKEFSWSDINSFDEIINQLKDEVNGLGKETKIILCRDMFQRGSIGATDAVDTKLLSGKYIPNSEWINYTSLMKELKAKFPQNNFSLGGIFSKDLEASYQTMIKGPSQIAAIKSPETVTYPQVNVMTSRLQASGIKVYDLPADVKNSTTTISQANILLLSGHKDVHFENYLKQLADEDLLWGKTVAIFSCNEKGTANLNSYLLAKGAKKIFFFPDRINIDAINAVFNELAELSKGITDGILFNELLEKAILKASDSYPELKKDIDFLLNLMGQTSFNNTLKNQDNG